MWYQRTSDAVYQNVYVLERERPKKDVVVVHKEQTLL